MKELNLQIEHLKKSYARPVLTDVNLHMTNESYVTIVGKSGSGKSTLLNILGLVEDYDGGEYRFQGKIIRRGTDYARLRLENIGFIFQSYNLIPTLSCKENILLPTLYEKRGSGRNLNDLVELLELGPLLSQRVTTLSGGEKQRVAIARALILDPCLILADEPTGNLDPKNRDIIMDLLRAEHEKGRAVLMITHDMEIARHAESVYLLEEGSLKESRLNDTIRK